MQPIDRDTALELAKQHDIRLAVATYAAAVEAGRSPLSQDGPPFFR